MKQIKQDHIEINYPSSEFDEFMKQLNEIKTRIETVWNTKPTGIGFGYDGEVTVYFQRLETDSEYTNRVNKEQVEINRELTELKRLKAKYGEI